MFIGHLPVGYLTARVLATQPTAHRPSQLWWAAALFGSVFPDFDMFYFYLIDGRQTLHHHYWTHLPVFWLGVAMIGVWHPISRVFLVSVMVHLLLDSIVGGVLWLWPFSDWSLTIVTVPAVHRWWVWNFVFHWTFVLEIILVVVAGLLWLTPQSRQRKRRGVTTRDH